MAKKTEEKILNQTKGTFRLIGKITGTERDNFYTSRIIERGKMKGKEMRSLRFGVKTSNQQTVYVQMTGYEPETVYLWNAKEKDKAKRSSKMSYDDYINQKEILEEDPLYLNYILKKSDQVPSQLVEACKVLKKEYMIS